MEVDIWDLSVAIAAVIFAKILDEVVQYVKEKASRKAGKHAKKP